MPEIKFKHVVSFSSEDKVYKAENILKAETYRKWKCSSPGEKNASIVLQFEKAEQIHSIDIGNESSAFIEVLVGRCSDNVSNFQVLLVASSFMSPAESRNGINLNRVRMFGPEKLAQNLKDEKWDCVQVICTQPFNKNTTYGLSFIKFHSPPEKVSVGDDTKGVKQLGAFKLKDEIEDESSPPIDSWLERKKRHSGSLLSPSSQDSLSYAAAVLASDNSPKTVKTTALKRKLENTDEDCSSSKKDVSIQPSSRPYPQTKQEKVTIRHELITPKPEKTYVQTPSTSKIKNQNNSFVHTNKKNNTVEVSSSRKENDSVNKPSKMKPFHCIFEGVVFVISGFVNPMRSEIRDKALEMGAKYKADWDRSCTHLICAFINTPKYIQVSKEKGKIVSKDWILDCHKKRKLMPWKKYMLGKYSMPSSEDSESDEDLPYTLKNAKTPPKQNGNSRSEGDWKITVRTPKVETSTRAVSSDETEDEDAIQDYLADTDDSGGDTEDEIMKVQEKVAKVSHPVVGIKRKGVIFEDEEPPAETRPDTSGLPLPVLPSIFKQKNFFLYGNFSDKTCHDLERYISAYDGILEDYMSDEVKYVVTESKWDQNFDEALSENNDIIFVRPSWIYKCHETGKFVPYQTFIVVPD